LLDLGGGHLARDRALPDELVESGLVLLQVAGDGGGLARNLRRPDRLVRLLRVLGLGLVLADEGRDVGLRILPRDEAADGVDRLGHDRHAVGSHVGDEADGLAVEIHALIEALGDLHGLLGGEAQLARGVHLQRRGGERREGVALHGFLLDRDHAELALLDRRLDGRSLGLRLDVELFQGGAGDGVEPGRELLSPSGGEQRLDGPVFLASEGLDLGLAVADEAQRHRLHAARGARARKLAPEHGREREADEVVERPARQIGGDQRRIDLAGILESREHRLLGDRVEGDPLDLEVLFQGLLLLEDLQDVPGDRLAFPIGVGSEDQFVRRLDGVGDFFEYFLGLSVNVPVHRKVVVGLDRPVLGRQIANVPEGGDDLVAAAEVLVDGLGLGGRFNDDDVHMRLSGWLHWAREPAFRRGAGVRPGSPAGPLGRGTWEMNAAVSNRPPTTFAKGCTMLLS
jgi:hypothetical protein